MQHSWSAFRESRDFDNKREYLINLRKLIDQWLAEPGQIRDLSEGPARESKRDNWARVSDPNAAFPFDEPGECEGQFFYFAYRCSSELFTREQLDTDEVKACPIGRCGYLVTLFEKSFATDNKTANHFWSDSVFDRHVKRKSADNKHAKDRYFVLADMAGHREGHTMIACSSNRRDQAVTSATTLAKKYGIRFLVARVVSCADYH